MALLNVRRIPIKSRLDYVFAYGKLRIFHGSGAVLSVPCAMGARRTEALGCTKPPMTLVQRFCIVAMHQTIARWFHVVRAIPVVSRTVRWEFDKHTQDSCQPSMLVAATKTPMVR